MSLETELGRCMFSSAKMMKTNARNNVLVDLKTRNTEIDQELIERILSIVSSTIDQQTVSTVGQVNRIIKNSTKKSDKE